MAKKTTSKVKISTKKADSTNGKKLLGSGARLAVHIKPK